MTPLNTNKRLDESTGIGQDVPNKAMQPASETNESAAPAKKTPLKRQGIEAKALIAILAVVALLTPISAMALPKVVVFIIGWGAGQALTAAKQAAIDTWLAVKKATATVDGAYWLSNRYSYSARAGSDTSLSNYDAPDSWRRVVVTQGHEIDDDPVGTADGQAMETEFAERYLEKQGRYHIVRRHGVLVNNDDETVLVMSMRARADSIAAYMKKVRATIRELHDDDSFNWKPSLGVRYSTYRHVGNHKMVSKYKDPNVPKVPKLATRVRGGGGGIGSKHLHRHRRVDKMGCKQFREIRKQVN